MADCLNFECPAQKLIFEPSCREDKLESKLQEHHFTHTVSMVIPGKLTKQHVNALLSSYTEQQYFIADNVPLLKVIDLEFIEAFIKRGNLYMLSCGTHIDTSELCVALYPPGRLVLNMSKDMYETSGLVGQPSQFNDKLNIRYVVTVDLTAACFHPDKKNYKRVEWCFANKLQQLFRFYIAWMPFDPTICPRSVGEYFKSCGYDTTDINQHKSTRQHNQFQLPLINYSNPEATDGNCCHYDDFFEWLGFTACACDVVEPDSFITSYCCPEPIVSHDGGCWLVRVTGMITPHSILTSLTQFRTLIEERRVPWISLTLHGFADSPVSSSNKEHGYHINGDNLLTAVLFANKSQWIYTALGSKDCV